MRFDQCLHPRVSVPLGLGLCLTAGLASAQDAPVVAEAPPSEPTFQDALTGGKFDVDIRFRYEYAEVGALDESHAATMRTRIGYTTERFAGFQGVVRLFDNHALDYSAYNAAGLNGQGTKSVIADPEDAGIDSLYLDYDFAELLELQEGQALSARVGRQTIVLDDSRWVGNVGWRQIEQTYDSATVKASPMGGLDLFYGYVAQVNRIFGPDSDRDFDSESHLFNAKLKDTPIGSVVGFAYLLDFENAAANSSQTYGVRIDGTTPLNDEYKLAYAASVALQSDYGDNTANYDALYYAGEAKLLAPGGLFGGVGIEVLGADDTNGVVTTPLATLHKFNGFADSFLATPAVGLRDYYGFVGTKLPEPFKGKIAGFYHYFTGDEDTSELGWEFDLVATHQINENATALVKYALFDGDGLNDVERFWLELTLKF